MKAKESIEERLKMAQMHDDVLERIDSAIKSKKSIEACWLCYACFESRVTRTLEKLSENCSKKSCLRNSRVGIVTRMECIKRLINLSYTDAGLMDKRLLIDIQNWCKKRNVLVHNLVSLNNYNNMDEKFLNLAKQGKPLVDKLYHQVTQFREDYYCLDKMPPFPICAENKCKLQPK